jgi:ADP-ribose pyrophosphatase YjhB (NUDIX family)
MKLENNQQFHFGVYGIYTEGNNILVIKKGRGPYKGLYDLPGGRIEFGEKIEDALKREFGEETGVSIIGSRFIGYNEYLCTYTNELGELKDFHHVGLYFAVNGDFSTIKNTDDGHDSLGALFIPKENLNTQNCSHIAFEIIQRL